LQKSEKRGTRPPKTRILLLGSPALLRVMRHLLGGRQDIEIVGALRDSRHLRRRAARLRPEITVVSLRLLRAEAAHAIHSITAIHPASKAVLIYPDDDFAPYARSCGADACIQEGALASRLLSVVRRLSAAGAGPFKA
jgi:DNA-binding NarL/FixJ family response regulator